MTQAQTSALTALVKPGGGLAKHLGTLLAPFRDLLAGPVLAEGSTFSHHESLKAYLGYQVITSSRQHPHANSRLWSPPPPLPSLSSSKLFPRAVLVHLCLCSALLVFELGLVPLTVLPYFPQDADLADEPWFCDHFPADLTLAEALEAYLVFSSATAEMSS